MAAVCACDGIRHPPSAFSINLLLESASTPGCQSALLSSVVVVALAACSTLSSSAIVLAGLVIVPRPLARLTLKCDMKQKISNIFNIRCLFFWYLIRLDSGSDRCSTASGGATAAWSKKGHLCHLFISRVRPIKGSLQSCGLLKHRKLLHCLQPKPNTLLLCMRPKKPCGCAHS